MFGINFKTQSYPLVPYGVRSNKAFEYKVLPKI
jgi:hypothetical protein